MRAKFTIAVFLSLAGLFYACPADQAASSDWIISIKTSALNKCLDYPGSKIKPIVRSSVYFEQGLTEISEEEKEMQKRGLQPDEEVGLTKYEDIFYGNFHVLGLKRYLPLRIKQGTPGNIKVTPGNSLSKHEEASAAANTTIRVYLNLYLHQCAVRSIIVPRDIFDTYISEMQRYGFRIENTVAGSFVRAMTMISVRSEPAGRNYYMAYGI